MKTLADGKIVVDINDGIAWLTFNNPEKRNAISLAMWQGLADAFDEFADDPSVRVVVMRGAGDSAFASGADIAEFDQHCANAEQRRRYSEISQGARDRVARFPKPLIALIRGACIGGGLATALLADVRFASPESRYGIPAAKLGIGYQHTLVIALARVIGGARTRDLLFSARVLGAEEALRLGLIDFLEPADDLEARVSDYARRVAANAPLSVRAAKASLLHYETFPGGAEHPQVNDLIDMCFDSDDYKEGRAAFAEKRVARFTGR